MSSGGSWYSAAEVELALAGLGGALALRRRADLRGTIFTPAAPAAAAGCSTSSASSGVKGLSSVCSSAGSSADCRGGAAAARRPAARPRTRLVDGCRYALRRRSVVPKPGSIRSAAAPWPDERRMKGSMRMPPVRRSNRVRSLHANRCGLVRDGACMQGRRATGGISAGRPLDRRVGRIDQQRVARRHRRAFARGSARSGSRNAPDRTGWRRSRRESRHSRSCGAGGSASSSNGCGLPRHRPTAARISHTPHRKGARRMRKISGRSVRFMPSAGAMAMKARAAQAGSIRARLPPLEWVSTSSRKRPTRARPTSPPGPAWVAAPPTSPRPDAGHAHHQQRQQQQRQPQPEEAEMMGAHHAHAPGDQRHRRQDDGEAEGLQQQVRDVGAGQAQQIVRARAPWRD